MLHSTLRTATLALALLALAPATLAQLPTLPVPPPPPSPSQILAAELARGLYPPGDAAAEDTGAEPLAGAFALTVTFPSPPAGATLEPFLAFIGDTMEAALRRAEPRLGPRVGDVTAATEAIAVTLKLEQGHLAATATRRTLPRTVWDRLESPEGAVVATAFSTVPVELEVRTLLGLGRRVVRLDRLRVVPVGDKSDASLRTAPVLDIAIADLDGDRVPEVVFLQPSRVLVARWERGGFPVVVASFDLSTTTQANDARVRTPLGRVVEVTGDDGRPVLIVASSERAGPVALRFADAALRVVGGGLPARWPLYASGVSRWIGAPWPRGVDVIDGPLEELGLGPEPGVGVGTLQSAYDLRAFPVRGSTSPTWSPFLASSDVEGSFAYWTPLLADATEVRDVGTTWAITDLDGDGTAELLTSSTALSGPDRVTLSSSLTSARGPARVWTGRLPAAVTALAAGDVDRDGYREFIVATWAGAQGEITVIVPREG